MDKSPNSIRIVNYSPQFAQCFESLRQTVIKRQGNLCLWAPGSEPWMWEHTLCAFDGEMLIGVGQARPISIVTCVGSVDEKHQIFLSIKALPNYEGCKQLFDMLYTGINDIARTMKGNLPPAFETMLCVSELATEQANSDYFISLGFIPFTHILTMHREIGIGLPDIDKDSKFLIEHQELLTDSNRQRYYIDGAETMDLRPLDLPHPVQYCDIPKSTAIGVFSDDGIAGRLIVWEEGGKASLEDVYVLPKYRNRGIARRMTADALKLIAEKGYSCVELMVLASNNPAIALYRSLGFVVVSEEIRLEKVLS